MTHTNALENKGKPAAKHVRKNRPEGAQRGGKGRRVIDTAELVSWLDGLGLGVRPTVKVNGPLFSTAVITVDLGSPLNPVRLSGVQAEELTRKLRALTRDAYNHDVNVRVSSDNQNGIFWSSVSA